MIKIYQYNACMHCVAIFEENIETIKVAVEHFTMDYGHQNNLNSM